MPARDVVRVVLVAFVVANAAPVVGSYAAHASVDPVAATPASAPSTSSAGGHGRATPTPSAEEDGRATPTPARPSTNDSNGDRTTRMPTGVTASSGSVRTAESLTVVATQGFYASEETAELVAFDEAGRVVYYDDEYPTYFDVDPLAGRAYTVEYVATRHYDGETCAPVDASRCSRNLVVRLNLTTGEERVVYEELTPRIYSARWHDVDRINETHLVVADIVRDGVYVVNTATNETTWRWNASAAYPPESGGKPGDWTHINDVEVLDDGTIMASLRNQDSVVFLRPGAGMNESRTLGSDGAHDVLYEQHNPDYIPPERGGPAVLVADSEGGRIVEYRRENGSWTQSWAWSDARLQWPRDADRLPDDDTLVVDSHGDRVVEVAPDGDVVWQVTVGLPYDAERLGTGDESAGGRSVAAIRDARESATNESGAVTHPEAGPVDATIRRVKDALPSLVVNGLLYVAPPWVRFADLLFAAGALGSLLAWTGAELYWARGRIQRRLGRLLVALRHL